MKFSIYSAHVQRLRKKYESLRKNKGEELEIFLATPFDYPAAVDATHPVVPPIIAGIGDQDVLRLQNVSLQKSLDQTEKPPTTRLNPA